MSLNVRVVLWVLSACGRSLAIRGWSRCWVLGVGVFPGAIGTLRHIFVGTDALVGIASSITQAKAQMRCGSMWWRMVERLRFVIGYIQKEEGWRQSMVRAALLRLCTAAVGPQHLGQLVFRWRR